MFNVVDHAHSTSLSLGLTIKLIVAGRDHPSPTSPIPQLDSCTWGAIPPRAMVKGGERHCLSTNA